MQDRNAKRVALVAAALILALLGVVYAQSHAAEAERKGKRTACEEARGVLAKAAVATAALADHPAGEDHSRAGEQEQQQAAHEEALVDASAKCTDVAVMPDRGRLVVSFFLAGVGPVVALIALFVNGVRYEAGMRNAFGGSASALEITPGGQGNGRVWNVRNVGLGPETIVGVSATTFPRRGLVDLSRSSFESLAERSRIEVGETLPFDVTTRGDDLLVAVLSEHTDGRHSASWARFGAIDAGGAYEKREDGRLLSI